MTKLALPSCVVMGSFKFKSEIDLVIRELKEGHISVLGPDMGDLYKSDTFDFWPLSSERKMSRGAVEQLFINKIVKSDFVYIVNPDGYIGTTVSLEIGVCIARQIPIYSQTEIDIKLDPDPYFADTVTRYISVESVERVIKVETESKYLREEEKLLKPSLAETLYFNNHLYRR